MVVIVALDDRGGMMFNKRRQSKDRLLRERVLQLSEGKRLLMNSYTVKQFPSEAKISQITVSEDFLSIALPGEYCFVENNCLSEYEQSIEKLIVYRWNRTYPSDMSLDLDLSSWTLSSVTDFAGSSHEKISEEVYVK